jgi:hypothetical protein
MFPNPRLAGKRFESKFMDILRNRKDNRKDNGPAPSVSILNAMGPLPPKDHPE